ISITPTVSTTYTRPTIITGAPRSRHVPIPYHRSTSLTTPCVQNFEMASEDVAGVVPDTPVLESHQLSKVQTLPLSSIIKWRSQNSVKERHRLKIQTGLLGGKRACLPCYLKCKHFFNVVSNLVICLMCMFSIKCCI
ncbi:hypothetical protein GBAR_LOCUS27660, partial [Geodia barretti]